MKGRIKLTMFLVLFCFFVLSFNVNAGEVSGNFFVKGETQGSWTPYYCGRFAIDLSKLNNIDGIPITNTMVYCAQHDKSKGPTQNPYVTAKVYYPDTPGYNKKIAAILYHSNGGPDNRVGTSNDSIVATDMALDNYFVEPHGSKQLIQNFSKYRTLIDLAEAEDCPEGTSYIVFTPSDSTIQTSIAYFTIQNPKPKVGNLSVAKKSFDDNDGYIGGATFHITGPNFDETYTTQANEIKTYENLELGEYTVTEISAPDNMIINTTPVKVTVEPERTVEAIIKNEYQRGSVRLVKLDENNDSSGDVSLKGAEFELHAAVEIKEGNNTVYKANQLVRKVVTDENGETEIIDDLPIGEYYYIETKSPQGYMTNKEKILVNVEYTGQDKPKATYYEVNCPETKISNDLIITKFIGQTENTQKSPIEGAVFTATLDSDSSVKRVSTPTDKNGYCVITGLPYGSYTIEETTVPSTTLKCSNFKLFVEEDKSVRGVYTLKDVDFEDKTNQLDTVGKQWLDEDGNLIDEPKVMHIKIRKVDKDGWEGKEKVDFTQGDAVLKGAVYSIYEWNDATNSYSSEPIKNITVDHKDEEGYWCAEQDNLIVGKKYMVKEKVKYTDTVNGKTYKYSFAEGYLVDETEFEFYKQPETQRRISSRRNRI